MTNNDIWAFVAGFMCCETIIAIGRFVSAHLTRKLDAAKVEFAIAIEGTAGRLGMPVADLESLIDRAVVAAKRDGKR